MSGAQIKKIGSLLAGDDSHPPSATVEKRVPYCLARCTVMVPPRCIRVSSTFGGLFSRWLGVTRARDPPPLFLCGLEPSCIPFLGDMNPQWDCKLHAAPKIAERLFFA